MSATPLRMPPHLQQTATLATQVIDADAPPWAVSRSGLTLDRGTTPSIFKTRSERDIFRLPNSSDAVREWLYRRPSLDALSDDAIENAAAESSTIFRIHPIDADDHTIEVSPTVSNHWLMVPFQSINGVTVGLAYLDILYNRPEEDLRVPPLPVGKFAIEDATGEVFVTGWGDDIMILGWIQSIIKCERVRELLMFKAPLHDGHAPTELLRRNSFYERRSCHMCGCGDHITGLPEPCSGIGPASPSPEGSSRLTNIATLYRRFRGAYFGVCLKTSYTNMQRTGEIVVPVFCDVRKGLFSVRQRFKNNLRRNVHFSLDCAVPNSLFGLSPRSSARLLIFQSNKPVSAHPMIMGSPTRRRQRLESWTSQYQIELSSPMSLVDDHDSSVVSFDRANSPSRRQSNTRRRVGVDEGERDTLEFQRRQRNRQAAAKSNMIRKKRLESQRRELRELKVRMQELKKREGHLKAENAFLSMQVLSL